MHMSPTLNGSWAIRRFEHSNAVETRDGITFNFYTARLSITDVEGWLMIPFSAASHNVVTDKGWHLAVVVPTSQSHQQWQIQLYNTIITQARWPLSANLFMYIKVNRLLSLDTSFASIFASNLAFLMRLTIHLSASSALRLSLVASMLRDKEWK